MMKTTLENRCKSTSVKYWLGRLNDDVGLFVRDMDDFSSGSVYNTDCEQMISDCRQAERDCFNGIRKPDVRYGLNCIIALCKHYHDQDHSDIDGQFVNRLDIMHGIIYNYNLIYLECTR